ncbi:RNA polymerase sigma-70 factor [Sphingobacteriaceae bacterium]|nr:RNA polymerase sigma-70 factor [Sphingobacteriaceae bacterium]
MTESNLTERDFGQLFELHYDGLCRIVFPILKDQAAAEDVVQDVFVKLWLRKGELQEIKNYQAYLYKSVVFRALDYLRKRKTEGLLKDELKIVSTQFQEADTALEQKELRNAIDAGLEKMPEQMRMIFHLSRFSGLKNREVAEQLNISIKTVESNLSKALKILADHLAIFSKNQTLNILIWLLTWYLLNT